MKPIEFPESNSTVAKNQPEYNPLPAYVDTQTDKGHVIFCLKMTLRERLIALLTGKVWCDLLCFGRPVTPSFHSVVKSDVLVVSQDSKGIMKLFTDNFKKAILVSTLIILGLVLAVFLFAKTTNSFLVVIAVSLVIVTVALTVLPVVYDKFSEFLDRVIEKYVILYLCIKSITYIALTVYIFRLIISLL